MSKFDQKRQNLKKAMGQLEKSLATPPTEDRDYAGIIKNFEFVYELTWRVLKVYLESQGIEAPFPRVVFENAYKHNLIEGNGIWKQIMESRNQSTHVYDEEMAKKLFEKIKNEYLEIFQKTFKKINELKG